MASELIFKSLGAKLRLVSGTPELNQFDIRLECLTQYEEPILRSFFYLGFMIFNLGLGC